MAGDMVTVTYGAFETAAENFATALGKLQATVDDLNQKVTQLTAGQTGNWAIGLNNNRTEVNQGMQGLQAVIAQIAKVIPEAAQTYQTADKTAASFFQ